MTRHNELSRADYEALAAFRHGVRRYLAFTDENARSAGLTSQQHQALLAIKAHTFSRLMSVGDLAAQLLLKHHSTVELVGRLEKAGLAHKCADVADRRKVLVSLTHEGEAVLSSLSTKNLLELRQIAPSFTGVISKVDALASAD